MSKETEAISHDIGQLANDARALLEATADVAGERVADARKRLTYALDRAREEANGVRLKVLRGAHAADDTVRSHPYQAIGVALGVGAVLGFVFGGACARRAD